MNRHRSEREGTYMLPPHTTTTTERNSANKSGRVYLPATGQSAAHGQCVIDRTTVVSAVAYDACSSWCARLVLVF
jgi:hypothetical protein